MNRETLAALIDAYADAKASKNKILIQSMIEKLEQALIDIFPDAPDAAPAPVGVDLPEEY